MILSTASNTLLQTMVDEAKRGRVMSLYTMAFVGTMPIGNLIAEGVAAHVGAPQTLRLEAIGCLLSALVFARLLPTLRPMLQPIYVNLGILQAATNGLLPPVPSIAVCPCLAAKTTRAAPSGSIVESPTLNERVADSERVMVFTNGLWGAIWSAVS